MTVIKSVVSFDLETIPGPDAEPFDPGSVSLGNLKDESKIAAKIEDAKRKYRETLGLDHHQCCICAFGWFDGEKGGHEIISDSLDEGELILKIWDILSAYNFFVTFNGNQFDVQVLKLHSLYNQVRMPVNIDTRKYRVTNHCDLRAVLTNWEPYARGDLNFFLKKCLGITKMEGIDGTMVSDAWDIGIRDKIGAYAEDDAEKTFQLYRHVSEYFFIG